jgi:hypothetical protein
MSFAMFYGPAVLPVYQELPAHAKGDMTGVLTAAMAAGTLSYALLGPAQPPMDTIWVLCSEAPLA